MIEIPGWVQTFVLVGIVFVIVAIPIKVLYEMTKGARDRSQRLGDLADRLRERFGAVRVEGGFLSPRRIHFTLDGRPASVVRAADDEIAVRLEPKVAPKFHAIVRTRGRLEGSIAVMWESFRILRRVRTFDPLIDESIAIYATPVFGGYFRELAIDGIPAQGKPTGLAESLIVLRRAPGVRRFELRMSPSAGFRVVFKLRTEDLVFRPDELESAIHHSFRLHDLLVMY